MIIFCPMVFSTGFANADKLDGSDLTEELKEAQQEIPAITTTMVNNARRQTRMPEWPKLLPRVFNLHIPFAFFVK